MLFSNEHMDSSGSVIQTIEPAGTFLTATSVSQILFACPINQQFQVLEVRSIFSTGSTSGTATVEYLTGTTAPGSGTAQTAAIALSGTANTLAVTAPITASLKTLSAGDRLNLIIAGTMTGLVGGFVQITLKRIK
jgi:hypothetical protein